jgi:hypothetical protein
VHETFDIGTEDHEINTETGSNVLILSSETPTFLDAHPNKGVRDAYATYLREIDEATSPTGRKEAANRNLSIIVTKVKAAGGADAPGASAPGIGTVDLHTSQQSKMRRSGIEVWFTESEHVIPRSFIDVAFATLAQEGVPMGGADYGHMHTILIYKGAANYKTHGPFGDQSKINEFKEVIHEVREETFLTRRNGLSRALDEMGRATVHLLEGFGLEAVTRTEDAIEQENDDHGEERGPEGSPEPPTPTASAVLNAASLQRDDINDQLQQRVNRFLSRRAASGGS